jgi:antitoxin component of MazEF toxin-antitoxin module
MTASARPSLTKTLVRHGNSLALVIDRPILDLLGIGEDTPLSLTTDGRRIVLTPGPAPARKERLREAMADADGKFAKMFKRLAE